jgi:hypothetical protein
MNTNLPSQLTAARGLSSECWAAIAGVAGSAILLLKKLLSARKPRKGDFLTRSEFYEHMIAHEERMSALHLATLEKLDANHRELLAALDRQISRIGALESGLARVDERTRQCPCCGKNNLARAIS